MDYLQKVQTGDKLRMPAKTYNAFVDAAKAHILNSQNVTAAGRDDGQMVNMVAIKNASGSDVSRFGVLGVNGVMFDPAVDQAAFLQQTVLSGTTPSSSSHSAGRFVICAEPIANGLIGHAWISGTCQVQIEVSDAAHEYADVSDGLTTKLASAESGPCAILWKESGTGTKWAVVRFGGSGGKGGSVLGMFRIVSNATGSGVYNCYEQVVDATDWSDTGAADKIDDLNTTGVQVFNLAENGQSGHVLSQYDLLVAWKMRDDEGDERWVGFSPKYAWWHS